MWRLAELLPTPVLEQLAQLHNKRNSKRRSLQFIKLLAFYPFMVLSKAELLGVNRHLAACRNCPTNFSSNFANSVYIDTYIHIQYMYILYITQAEGV